MKVFTLLLALSFSLQTLANETGEDTLPELSEAPPAPESEPSPELELSSDSSSDSNASSSSLETRDLTRPYYQQVKPQWAFGISGSLKALGGGEALPDQGNIKLRGVNAIFEFQPSFLQAIGVIGFGPSVGLYFPNPSGSYTKNPLSIYSYGGQARYQARFFNEQILVPYVGYAFEKLNYSLASNSAQGNVSAQGPIFGGMLLLNQLDPTAAAEIYVNYEVCRSYLFAEVQSLVGTAKEAKLSGSSVYAGFRLEM